MLHHEDDIPGLKQKLKDAIGRRAVVVNRIAELRPLTDAVERRCRSIRLATWACLYDQDPPEAGDFDPADACETVAEAVALMAAMRAPVAAELVELKSLREEESAISREVDRIQKDLEAIARKTAKRRNSTPKKSAPGSLL